MELRIFLDFLVEHDSDIIQLKYEYDGYSYLVLEFLVLDLQDLDVFLQLAELGLFLQSALLG